MKDKCPKAVLQSFILMMFLLVLAGLPRTLQQNVEAQVCTGPPIFSDIGVYDPYWPAGSDIKVYFKQGDFNSTQRNTMKQAFEAWESRRFDTCSNVTFNDSAYIELAQQPTTGNVGSYVWISTQEFGSAAQVFTHPTTGIIFATMIIGQNNIIDGTLLATTKHEIGHTFYLANCGDECPLRTSIMGPQIYADSDIGDCDVGVLSQRVYCPPLPPTPVPPPYEPCYDPTICTDSVAYCECREIAGYWDPVFCQCDWYSPVIVDALGNGFSLTDAQGGINFDFDNDGTPEQSSWTVEGSDDAFLVLDRDNSGTIDNGTELFGNFSPQTEPPPGVSRNGFNALAEYDKAGEGGNGDGVIDKSDAVFSQLRLWQDVNHNGLSEANELYRLPGLGVATLDLDYKESKRRDEYGNQFLYRAKVKDAKGEQVGRWAWDVFFVSTQ